MTVITAADIKERLTLLSTEQAAAHLNGLDANHTYMADLESDLTATRAAYVGFAVTEIATLRGMLGGRVQG